ncbi:enoyl-CoA hydratase/isomerase family protein [Burkholderia sp. L27(2015)]|uniref:enoyl-CoA hydratase/isomerase family protein n=1 Tax=Burkholderia sp. L27(2015) TaxID=1641858 RepID=UPI00131E0B93|nr:enoyl-CoA hydratase/isomerase family protein [Burkholderia sp. L27(2015)]
MTEGPMQGVPLFSVEHDIARITLNRPDQHNRIDPDDLPLLAQYVADAERSGRVRALVISGAGSQTFSSGYTLSAIAEKLDRGFELFLDALENCALPTLCALNGSVYGGATDLALCCDFRIGVVGSRMFMPAARIGLHYYPGGMRRYITALGLANAKRLFLTGMTLDAAEMLRIGFLTDLVAPHELSERTASYLEAMASCDIDVIRSMKQQLNRIAAGDAAAIVSRSEYEKSLASTSLRDRLAALAVSPKTR